MADDLAGVMRRQDKRILISIVDDIGRQLRLIVYEKREIFRAEYQQYFPVHGTMSRSVSPGRGPLSKRMTSIGNMWKGQGWCETLCSSNGTCSSRRLSRASFRDC